MVITVLCKVVDNFGDIGVVWRLCKQIKKINSFVQINLVVDDLISFNKICSEVNISGCNEQQVQNINIVDWNAYDFCYSKFSVNDGEQLSLILECFQCGRPEWMEKILFEDKLNRTVQIIMIDYLTAEQYAEDFHCLESLTRSKKVQKVNFMPGFTNKTGGLIIDDEWKNLPERKSDGPVLVFTYERNWKPLVNAMLNSQITMRNGVKVAQGRGMQSFVDAWNEENAQFAMCNEQLEILDFLQQNEWDKMMKNCSVLFIRGEESMSRACLSGIPFVWHAYPQSDEYQLVKVNALLGRMSRYFKNEDFEIIKKVWLCFNSPEKEVDVATMMTACSDFLNHADSFVYGFKDFALDLRKNGDLAANLMTLIEKKYIIE